MRHHWKLDDVCPQSVDIVRRLPRGATVADIGCYGWLLGDAAHETGINLVGVDQAEPPGRPSHARFVRGWGVDIDLPDDSCDLVVAGHVLEHVADGVAFTAALLRIVKPGGHLWIETPSELSCLAKSTDEPDDQSFRSFWDDPTHIRPWTPGALYRLAISCQAIPLAIQRTLSRHIPSTTMLARKPEWVRGAPATRYVMLRDVPRGLKQAYEAIWGNTHGRQ